MYGMHDDYICVVDVDFHFHVGQCEILGPTVRQHEFICRRITRGRGSGEEKNLTLFEEWRVVMMFVGK